MRGSRGIQVTCLTLSLVGLVVAAYLTVAHYTSPALLVCSDRGMVDCAQVTSSPQSVVLGVPVADLGALFFVAMSILNLPPLWRSSAPIVRGARLGLVWVGMGSVLWLIYAELFLVHAICLYCSLVHAVTFALFVLIVFHNGEENAVPTPDTGARHA